MTRRLPSTQALLCFEAVAQTGSVTRASEQLNMTQSAVSRQIRTLENLLGVPLFERSRQRLKLNEPGQAYLDSVTAILEDLSLVTQRTRRAASGHLRVGIEPALASSWLIPRLGAFTQSHPRINVELMTDMERLHSGTAQWDLAIVYGEKSRAGMDFVPLMQEELVVVGSTGLIKKGPAIKDFADVLHYPIVHHTGRFSASTSWLTKAGVPLQQIEQLPGPRMETFSLVLQCAIEGLGLAFLPTFFVADSIKSGSVLQASPINLACEEYYYLAVPQQQINVPAVTAFSDWLQTLPQPGWNDRRSV